MFRVFVTFSNSSTEHPCNLEDRIEGIQQGSSRRVFNGAIHASAISNLAQSQDLIRESEAQFSIIGKCFRTYRGLNLSGFRGFILLETFQLENLQEGNLVDEFLSNPLVPARSLPPSFFVPTVCAE